jgi:hypothetical protein
MDFKVTTKKGYVTGEEEKEKENKFGGGGSKLVVNKREGQTVRGERKGSEAKL